VHCAVCAWMLGGFGETIALLTSAGDTAPQAGNDERSVARRRGGAGGKAPSDRYAAPAARRTGRKGGEYNHITQAMLKEGGYFDMPIQARSCGVEPLLAIRGASLGGESGELLGWWSAAVAVDVCCVAKDGPCSAAARR